MKRSQMVINIAIELMGRLSEWEKQERLNFASEILQVCEIEGMKPPYSNEGLSNYDIAMGSEVYRWEPEDG